MEITLHGEYKNGTYDKKINKTKFRINTKETVPRDKNGDVVSVGSVYPDIPEGTPLHISGTYGPNSVLEADSVSVVTDTEEISKKFVQNTIRHIRKVRKNFKVNPQFAKKLVAEFGPDIVSYIDKSKNADEIKKLFPKMHPKQIDLIYEEMRGTVESFAVISYFSQFGFSQWKAYALTKKYGKSALRLLKRDPYKYGSFVQLTFYECDMIALKNNMDPLGDIRMRGLMTAAHKKLMEQNGSTVVMFSHLMKTAKYIAAHSSFPDVVIPDRHFATQLERNPLLFIIDDGSLGKVPRVMSTYYQRLNKDITSELSRLMVLNATDFEESMIDATSKELNIDYSEGQRDMQKLLSSVGIKIVTGGPGAGKTTGVNGLIHTYKRMYPDKIIKLCAPTGRAAQRMNELTGMDATTIHKMIKLKPFEGADAEFNEEANLEADLIIVDEFSMVDEELFLHLLKAIKTGTMVILVGDEDQLPSVGPGAVLRDLIASEKIPYVRLDGSYRAGSSSLIANAHKILAQDTDFVIDDSFHREYFAADEDLATSVVEQFLKEYDAANPFKIQILVTANKGVCGTRELNRMILSKLFPENKDQFCVNERVLFTRNNMEEGYVNGDLGIITDISEKEMTVDVCGELITVNESNYEDILPSYAMTIHKSQGSEFPHVITVLPSHPKIMLSRNLFYTAVTRAKKLVDVMAVNGTIDITVSKFNNRLRTTRLRETMQKYFKQQKGVKNAGKE